MPGRPKSGPPYTDIPDEIYVVVTNPWSMSSKIPKERGQNDFDRVASWAQLVLQQAGLGGRLATIECIYSMGTRDEVIIQFEAGTDIIPLLGEHRWANIVKDWSGPPNDPVATRVFIYNWRNNGDPSTHNWTDNYPNPLPLNGIPAKSPYPPPSWTRPPTNLTNFVLPIPHPPLPLPLPVPVQDEQNTCQEQQSETPTPPSTEISSPAPPVQNDQLRSGKQPATQGVASSNLFRPYEPPSQHPSNAQFLHQGQTACEEPSRTSPPPSISPKFIKKLDPYELEEDALNALHSPEEDPRCIKEEEDIKPTLPISVKEEVKTEDEDTISTGSGYQPSRALIDAFNSLPQREQVPSESSAVAASRDRSSGGYQPSQALIDAFKSLPRHKQGPSAQTDDPRNRPRADCGTTPPASSGYRPHARLEAEINSFLSGAAATPLSAVGATVKREREEDVNLGEGKRIKVEEC